MRAGRARGECVRSCRWQSRAAIAREVPLVLGLGMGQRAEAARAIRLAFPPTRRPICASRRLRSGGCRSGYCERGELMP